MIRVEETTAKAPRRTLIWAVAASLIAVVAASAFLWWKARERRIEEIRELVVRREFAAARPKLESWLRGDPNSGEAHYLMGRLELGQGHPQEAIRHLGKALDAGFPSDVLAPWRAAILANTEQFAGTEALLLKALRETNEPRPEMARALARVYLSTLQLPKAVEPIQRWMKDAPDDPEPYLFLNEVETRSDADRSAIAQNFREALKRDPNLAKARFGLADILRQSHFLEEAAEEFDRYTKQVPDNPEGHLGAARVALARGHEDDAAKKFDRVLELDPKEPNALKERGSIDLRRGRYESARAFLERAIATDPYDPDAHYNLNLVLRRLNQAEEAEKEKNLAEKLRQEHARIADLRSQVVKRPKDLGLLREITAWLLEHGRDPEGLRFADRVLKDHPGDPATIDLLVHYYERKGDAGRVNYYKMLTKTNR